MNKLKQVSQLLSNMGPRYLLFRVGFELRRKTGMLRNKFPVHPAPIQALSFSEWMQVRKPFFFADAEDIALTRQPDMLLAREAAAIREGRFVFFSGIEFNLGTQYDWITNPDSGFRYDREKHWTEVNDYSSISGDIKFVWEKSRFSYFYTLIRDEHHNGNSHGEFIFREIESWIDSNPVNQGPNYKCSQEISLRVFNWLFAIYYYSNSGLITESLWQKMMNVVYWQMEHVYHNINFSRIAVRNNHAITETLALYVAGTLFPWMKNSHTWKSKGKKWFEQEIRYQVYEDGTFLQFSMNYHRVVVQLLTWGIALSARNKETFSLPVYERAFRSVEFLYQCQEESNGHLPNYGANDGALFFPLNSAGYRDYKPQLNALHELLCGQPLYTKGESWKEDAAWMGAHRIPLGLHFEPVTRIQGGISYPQGGYYLVRDLNTLTFIRCGSHKDRPSQADNLHIDIWADGRNVFADNGSYKYNTDAATLRYFMGTASHNTIMLNGLDQMKKGARFIWYYWTQRLSAGITETADAFVFSGTIAAFKELGEIKHTRIITKQKGKAKWVIEDKITGAPLHTDMEQLWHLHPEVSASEVEIEARDADGALAVTEGHGFYSGRYGEKTPAVQFEVATATSSIHTTILIPS